MSFDTVKVTSDFLRIFSLPKRIWQEEMGELTTLLAKYLKTDRGTMDLWPIQVAALQNIHDNNGAFLPISVGGGKALISLLAPVVLESKRPVLFVPASLREQTKQKVIPMMRQHWKLHPYLKVIGYSELSLAKNVGLLEDLRPDLIILDEAHSVKRSQAGRTKRLKRYLRKHPETKVVAMSGTISNRSIMDYHHIILWCLKDKAPLPLKWREASVWALALDQGVSPTAKAAPGALLRFCEKEETARQGYRRRLTETPGVVASPEEELGISLQINKIEVEVPKDIENSLYQLRNTWIDPNGDIIAEATCLWMTARQIAMGFWYKWDPPAPTDWMEARKDWKRYVCETLKHNQRNLDTELQVWNECAEQHNFPKKPKKPKLEDDSKFLTDYQIQKFEERSREYFTKFACWKTEIMVWENTMESCDCVWCNWRKIRDNFKPNPVPVWEDYFIIEVVENWLKKEPGIIWVEYTALGELLSSALKIPYFGAGKNASIEILNAEGPIVASINAHGQGKNLQRWDRNLVTSPPTTGKTWEQLIGRTHRAGQQSDTVIVDVLMHTEELQKAFGQALGDAKYLQDTLGGKQRLNYADITF